MTDLSKLVKPLVWHKSRGAHIMDGESHTVPTGYTVRYADENGWKWSTPLGAYGWECSPSLAKAAAQADYTARIFAALDPEALAQWRDEAVQAEREACAKLRYFHPEGETMAQMRDHARNHPIYREGDLKLVWVNEGDLCNLAIRARKGCTP